MIAVAKIGGHQSIVKPGDIIDIDKMDEEVGKEINLEVLLVSEEDGQHFKIGTPFIEGVSVEAKILEHGKGDKVRVFKMKPRKRYRKTLSHRQDFTKIEILRIQNAGEKEEKKSVISS